MATIINLNPVSITNVLTDPNFLISPDLGRQLASSGMTSVSVYPSVDIVLVDSGGVNCNQYGVQGTAANSPFICPANVVTMIDHRAGALKAISKGATSNVLIGIRCSP